MKAMILAGGLSTRLYPLTKQVPKPLVPVVGEPNAVHLIRYLKAHGIDRIAINVHYLADMIVDTLGDGSAYGVRLEYLHEKVLLGSAGAVEQMKYFLGDAPFVVVGCDDLTDIPLDRLLAFHREKQAVATIGLVQREEVDQYGVVVTAPDGRITGFQEKPAKGTERSKLVNTGIYAFTPEIFDHIPAGVFYDFGKNVFPALQQAQAAFYGYDARGAYWCDIGTPGEYRRATHDVLSGAFRIPGHVPITSDVWIGAGARVAKDALITGPSVVGDGVEISSGARIERSIIWQGARIGEGAALRNAIVGMNYRVEAGTTLEDAIVANEPDAAPA
ncbi:MAG TPA: NDP-sugar synthase [Candidatus Baltobacteraceae bacterium]|nr:NDP-sugar synthase [Candidatus Baltobacteraceae bacterium]